MEKLYILNIVDNDDNFEYLTLGFKTKQELINAQKAIELFDNDFYITAHEHSCNYFEELCDFIDRYGVNGIKIEKNIIRVR